jgi:hypothetical protein
MHGRFNANVTYFRPTQQAVAGTMSQSGNLASIPYTRNAPKWQYNDAEEVMSTIFWPIEKYLSTDVT